MRDVTAAAIQAHREYVGPDIRHVTEADHESVREILSAQLVAEVGCKRCEGTNELTFPDIDGAMTPCPVEHVLCPSPYGWPFLADPDKVKLTEDCPKAWGCNNLGYEKTMNEDEIKACKASHVHWISFRYTPIRRSGESE